MKRFSYAILMALALTALVSTAAMAGGEECAAKTAAAQVKMGDCCIKAAKAGEGCCGKDAATVKAAYAGYKEGCADKAACEAATADMHKCCAEAMAAGNGCCGKDADALKASYEEKVAYHKAAAAVKADMHECCATAMAAGNGCCGHSAEEMKADFDKKVEAKAKKVASQETESADS
jgi:Tfp pilus assembly protein PilW